MLLFSLLQGNILEPLSRDFGKLAFIYSSIWKCFIEKLLVILRLLKYKKIDIKEITEYSRRIIKFIILLVN